MIYFVVSICLKSLNNGPYKVYYFITNGQN